MKRCWGIRARHMEKEEQAWCAVPKALQGVLRHGSHGIHGSELDQWLDIRWKSKGS